MQSSTLTFTTTRSVPLIEILSNFTPELTAIIGHIYTEIQKTSKGLHTFKGLVKSLVYVVVGGFARGVQPKDTVKKSLGEQKQSEIPSQETVTGK